MLASFNSTPKKKSIKLLTDRPEVCYKPSLNLCVLLRQAFQLIRAVSVLLNFTREEEDMLKQTLEYKVGVYSQSLYSDFRMFEFM